MRTVVVSLNEFYLVVAPLVYETSAQSHNQYAVLRCMPCCDRVTPLCMPVPSRVICARRSRVCVTTREVRHRGK
jgi:hypothetical protein